jgi:preprotein translocase subunit SecY
MFNAVANLFRIPELRKRLLLTVGLLIVYRIGWNIPLPGIDPRKMESLARS